MRRVRITVLRKAFYPDVARRYLTDGEDARCDAFEEGDVFFFDGQARMPEGFCPWAWLDIGASAGALYQGASYVPWQNRGAQNICCCTDGVRPVSFLLEAVEA